MKTTRRRRCGSVSKLCPDPTLSDLLVIGAIPPHLPRYASAIEHARPISSHAADENIRYHTPASRSRKQRDRRLRYGEGAHRRECVAPYAMRSLSVYISAPMGAHCSFHCRREDQYTLASINKDNTVAVEVASSFCSGCSFGHMHSEDPDGIKASNPAHLDSFT